MALLQDRVQETTTTAGTGTFTLGGAVTGYVTFNSVFTNGNIVWYTCDDGAGNWEIGTGTVGTGTLTRTVFQSSNGGSLVNFAAGAKRLFCSAPYTYYLPDQTGNNGKLLTTSGTTPSWTSTLPSGLTFTDVVASGGVYAQGALAATFTDGIVLDYATGNGRISVGTADNLTFYTGGIANTAMAQLTSTGINNTAIGATTASTGAFTTLSASSTVSGTGFTNYFASPPPIGSTAANTGAFTTLTATGAITHNTTTNNQSYTTTGAGTITLTSGTTGTINNFNIGGTTPGTGAFTTLTASADSSFTSTGALLISKGTTGQQPGTPVTGMIRYNTTTNQFEGYAGSSPSWLPVGGSVISNDTSTATQVYPIFANATSGTATTVYTSNANLLYTPSTGLWQAKELYAANGIILNNTTVASSFTFPTGANGNSIGPMVINSGVVVTVPSGQRWLIQ